MLFLFKLSTVLRKNVLGCDPESLGLPKPLGQPRGGGSALFGLDTLQPGIQVLSKHWELPKLIRMPAPASPGNRTDLMP